MSRPQAPPPRSAARRGLTSWLRASGDESFPSIRSEGSWRVRMEPGIPPCMGCVLPLGPTSSRLFLHSLSRQEHTLYLSSWPLGSSFGGDRLKHAGSRPSTPERGKRRGGRPGTARWLAPHSPCFPFRLSVSDGRRDREPPYTPCAGSTWEGPVPRSLATMDARWGVCALSASTGIGRHRGGPRKQRKERRHDGHD